MTRLPLQLLQLRQQEPFPAPVNLTARVEAGPRVRLTLLAEAHLVEVVVLGDGTPDDTRWLLLADVKCLVPAPEALVDDQLAAGGPPAPPRGRGKAKPPGE